MVHGCKRPILPPQAEITPPTETEQRNCLHPPSAQRTVSPALKVLAGSWWRFVFCAVKIIPFNPFRPPIHGNTERFLIPVDVIKNEIRNDTVFSQQKNESKPTWIWNTNGFLWISLANDLHTADLMSVT